MVVENIIKIKLVEKDPLYAIPLGMFLSSLGIVIGLWIFPEDASIAGVLFTTIAGIPFFRRILKYEENVEEHLHSLKKMFKRNEWTMTIFGMFFIGMVISYSIWYLVLPDALVASLFGKQLAIFGGGSSGFVGKFLAAKTELFLPILGNNIKVIILILILSLLYGSGAIMILAWNASVLGIFIGSFGSVTAFMPFIPHTIIEFVAFFFAAVAGGLISIAIDKDKIGSLSFDKIAIDGMILFLIAFGLVALGAAVEILV